MAVQTIMVHLPETLYQQLKRRAERMHRSIESEVLEVVAEAMPFDEKQAIDRDESPPNQHERNLSAVALIEQWLSDESGYDERVWPVLEAELREAPLRFREL